jgi:hypothetical protein
MRKSWKSGCDDLAWSKQQGAVDEMCAEDKSVVQVGLHNSIVGWAYTPS